MSGFDEVVRDGYEARVQAITEGGGVPRKRARSVLTAIRRRRAVRASATTGVSLLAVGALALGAINLGPADEAPPGSFPLPTTGAYPWCDVTSYPAVNPDALGAFPYAGRIYANMADGEYVYVSPDGSRRDLVPTADGSYSVTAPGGVDLSVRANEAQWTYSIWDFGTDGYGNSAPYAIAPEDVPYYAPVTPSLLYEWTTTAPSDAPAGINENTIAVLQLMLLGFPGSVEVGSYVPAGAVLEQVVRYSDGRERVAPVAFPMGEDEEHQFLFFGTEDARAGVESVSLRATGLPGGETYEVTSTYEASKTWEAACGTNLNAGPSVVPPPATGPYFEGPESQLFSCDAALRPEDENAIPTTVEARAGVEDVSDYGATYDFGAGGVVITSLDARYPVAGLQVPPYPGWGYGFAYERSGARRGATLYFGALAWIDGDGVLVGREVAGDDGSRVPEADLGPWNAIGTWVDGHDSILVLRGNLQSRGAACDGVNAATFAAASIVWIQGRGPDEDDMTWSWTRVWPVPQS